jgi:hypothetical protein
VCEGRSEASRDMSLMLNAVITFFRGIKSRSRLQNFWSVSFSTLPEILKARRQPRDPIEDSISKSLKILRSFRRDSGQMREIVGLKVLLHKRNHTHASQQKDDHTGDHFYSPKPRVAWIEASILNADFSFDNEML